MGGPARRFGLALPHAAIVCGDSGWYDHPDRHLDQPRGVGPPRDRGVRTLHDVRAHPHRSADRAGRPCDQRVRRPQPAPGPAAAPAGGAVRRAQLLGAHDRGAGRAAGRPPGEPRPAAADRGRADRLLRAGRRGGGPDCAGQGAEGRRLPDPPRRHGDGPGAARHLGAGFGAAAAPALRVPQSAARLLRGRRGDRVAARGTHPGRCQLSGALPGDRAGDPPVRRTDPRHLARTPLKPGDTLLVIADRGSGSAGGTATTSRSCLSSVRPHRNRPATPGP